MRTHAPRSWHQQRPLLVFVVLAWQVAACETSGVAGAPDATRDGSAADSRISSDAVLVDSGQAVDAEVRDLPPAHEDASAGDAASGGDAFSGGDAASGDDAISGSDAATNGTDAAGPVTYRYTCDAVGTAYSDGVFALESFNGKVYAGLFGYEHESQSMLYSYPEWQLTAPGLTGLGESVCMLRRQGSLLFANTENSGDIFVSSDGNNWTREHNGDPLAIGCGLAELDGVMYAVSFNLGESNHGRILQRQANGSWSIVYDSGSEALALREIVAYAGALYAFGHISGQGYMVTSPNGTNWTRTQTPVRMFRGYEHDNLLWLGSSNFGSPASAVAIWRYDGTTFTRVHDAPGSHVTDVREVAGRFFATTSNGWKEATGPSYLLLSENGGADWRSVCTFSDTAAWKMTVNDGELYVGTWTYGGHGKLYHVQITASTEPPPDEVDCSLISAANSSWEVCQTGTDFCAGVYSDGAGCHAFCAAAGLQCVAHYGGDVNCVKETQNVFGCDESTGNMTDWCECQGAGDPPPPPRCEAQAGSLSVGQTYTVNVDAHTGDEGTTEPKVDANSGLGGDNPRFRRQNVARAHNDYWYTSSNQGPGEPSPSSEQWVDYVPDFAALGIGCYHVVARYRATDSRATYPAQYRIINSAVGDVLIERVQQRADGVYIDEDLGNHVLCSNAYVRIQDPGPNSITFNEMRFIYLGPTCP